jgi:ABC-2 type transport system ATP-binding protein
LLSADAGNVSIDGIDARAHPQTRSQLLRVVRELARNGAAVVYSTHYFPEVAELDASVVILERGHVLARGNINEIVAAHSVGMLELEFAGPPPDVARLFPFDSVTTSGSCVRIETNDTAAATTVVLANLDSRAVSLRGLTVLQPSLESAFLRLTTSESTPNEEVADVA